MEMTRKLDNDGKDETSADGTELKILNDDQRRSAQFLRDSSSSVRDETDRDETDRDETDRDETDRDETDRDTTE